MAFTEWNEQTMNNLSNPYAAPTTSETTRPTPEPIERSSSVRLRGIGISMQWIAIAVASVIARSTMLPMFEDFGIQLPMLTLIALSRTMFVGTLLIGVIILPVAMFGPDNRMLRRFLNAAFVAAVVAALVLIFALISPLLNILHSLS